MGGRRVGGSEDRCKERMEREIVELKGLLDRSKLEFYRRLKSYSRMFLLLLSREAGGRIGFVFNVIKPFVSSEHRQNLGVIKIKEREVFTLPFVSKALDYLDIKSILLDTRIEKLLPKTLQEFFPLKVFYSYDIPIGRKIFNYNELLQGLSNEVLRNVVGSECGCSESSYMYGPHGHVLTGDLSVVSNNIYNH